MAAVRTTVAAGHGTQINILAAAEAGTIASINLPNFNGLPNLDFRANVAANSIASVSSVTFSTVFVSQQKTGAAANPGANIISVDVAALFTAGQANPAVFGIINTT